ncbi:MULTISPECIES: RICIN domain-containing protein [Kitasatospora]
MVSITQKLITAAAVTTLLSAFAATEARAAAPAKAGPPHTAKIHHVSAEEKAWARGEHKADPPRSAATAHVTPAPRQNQMSAQFVKSVNPAEVLNDVINLFRNISGKQYIEGINEVLDQVRYDSDGQDAAVVFYLGEDHGTWDDSGAAYNTIDINGYKYGVLVFPQNHGGFWYYYGYGQGGQTSTYWGSSSAPAPSSTGRDPNFNNKSVDFVSYNRPGSVWGTPGDHGASSNGQRGNLPDGSWITIINRATYRAVDSAQGQSGDGNKIQSWGQHDPNEASQGWRLDHKSGYNYALTSRLHDGQVLNLNGNDNRSVQMYHYDGSGNSQWGFEDAGDGWSKIHSTADWTKCLNDNGSGNQLTAEPCSWNLNTQIWGTYAY